MSYMNGGGLQPRIICLGVSALLTVILIAVVVLQALYLTVESANAPIGQSVIGLSVAALLICLGTALAIQFGYITLPEHV